MHEGKPYVVTYAFFGFTIHHRDSKLTVARPCVVHALCRKCLNCSISHVSLMLLSAARAVHSGHGTAGYCNHFDFPPCFCLLGSPDHGTVKVVVVVAVGTISIFDFFQERMFFKKIGR